MANRKGAAKILLCLAFSHNQNVMDARTEFTDTQDTPNRKLAENRSHVPYESSLILPWIKIMLDP